MCLSVHDGKSNARQLLSEGRIKGNLQHISRIFRRLKSTDLPPGRQPKRTKILAFNLFHESRGGDKRSKWDTRAAWLGLPVQSPLCLLPADISTAIWPPLGRKTGLVHFIWLGASGLYRKWVSVPESDTEHDKQKKNKLKKVVCSYCSFFKGWFSYNAGSLWFLFWGRRKFWKRPQISIALCHGRSHSSDREGLATSLFTPPAFTRVFAEAPGATPSGTHTARRSTSQWCYLPQALRLHNGPCVILRREPRMLFAKGLWAACLLRETGVKVKSESSG